MKVALVHDWLTGMRGGEKALEVLCERFPNAELYTLVHVRGSVSPTIERLRTHTSFLQHLPGIARHYRQYLPLFPVAIEQFSFDRFDLVISVSHCCAKAVVTPARTRHVCYCLTPVRYAWDQFDAYFGPARIGAAASRLMRPAMAGLARWDRATAGRVDRYVAISHHVAGRIRRYYNRESTVVYPPVDTDFFHPAQQDDAHDPPHALVVSALVPYKRLETAILACRLAAVPLTIVGDGPERARLERFAAAEGGEVVFRGRVPDELVRDEYRRASVVLLPGEEDFGIVPVEAQACGRPVVALARGGACETVVPGVTGLLVGDASPDAFGAAVRHAMAQRFDAAAIRQHAERFSRRRFADQIDAVIHEPRDAASQPAVRATTAPASVPS
jgi:glycosyltransferase involved in cell wall biosynthesis